jgi:hypothetical protein
MCSDKPPSRVNGIRSHDAPHAIHAVELELSPHSGMFLYGRALHSAKASASVVCEGCLEQQLNILPRTL